MTIEEYIAYKKFRPLTDKEKEKGKGHLKIYGTQDPMPWSTIFTRLAAGQPMDEVAMMYGHGRQIALWAQEEGITVQPFLEETVKEEVEHRKRINSLANASLEVAGTLMEMVNEVAPDFHKQVAMFSAKVVERSMDILKGKFLESQDIVNVTKAVQTVTDTIGVTQRHASASSHTTNNIKVDGFTFVEDLGPQNYIEGEIDG